MATRLLSKLAEVTRRALYDFVAALIRARMRVCVVYADGPRLFSLSPSHFPFLRFFPYLACYIVARERAWQDLERESRLRNSFFPERARERLFLMLLRARAREMRENSAKTLRFAGVIASERRVVCLSVG